MYWEVSSSVFLNKTSLTRVQKHTPSFRDSKSSTPFSIHFQLFHMYTNNNKDIINSTRYFNKNIGACICAFLTLTAKKKKFPISKNILRISMCCCNKLNYQKSESWLSEWYVELLGEVRRLSPGDYSQRESREKQR